MFSPLFWLEAKSALEMQVWNGKETYEFEHQRLELVEDNKDTSKDHNLDLFSAIKNPLLTHA